MLRLALMLREPIDSLQGPPDPSHRGKLYPICRLVVRLHPWTDGAVAGLIEAGLVLECGSGTWLLL